MASKIKKEIDDDEWSEIAEAISLGVVSWAYIGRLYSVTRSHINNMIKSLDVKRGDKQWQVA